MDETQHTTTEAHAIPTSQVDTDHPTGGPILVEVMRRAGVDVAFGVISIHNIPLVEAVDRDLRFVPVRHEAAAVNAADGYARSSGRIGVAITSTGTGAGNAAGAMLEALTAQSRVLHVTGNIASTFLGEDRGVYHEVPRQLEMLRSVSQHALRVERARDAGRVIADAVRLLAIPPHGPVSIDWPIDLQYTADPATQIADSAPGVHPVEPDPRAVDAAVAVMRRARRPLIWAGGGARGVGHDLVRLAEAWGAGVLTGAAGRGSIPEHHARCIGNFAAVEGSRDLIEDADCLLTVGSHLRANETDTFELPLPSRHVQIDLDPQALGRNYDVTVGIRADAARAVPALLDALGDVTPDDGWAERVATVRAAVREDHRAEIGAYSAICDVMRRRLPRSAPLVRDVAIPTSSWGNRLLEIDDPHTNIFAAGGGIGQGLAMAIGAGAGRPDGPVLAMVGDGGLAVHLGELATLAAARPHVILVVFNDGGYGVLRNMQRAKGTPHRAVDLASPDFALLARSVGLPHVRVTDPDGFDTALAAAVERRSPSMIEIDVPALDPQPQPLIPPVSVP